MKHTEETTAISNLSRTKTFGEALLWLKAGGSVTRGGWNGQGQLLELQVPDEHSKMGLPYIFITTGQGKRVPWVASQTDLLSDDWLCLAWNTPAAGGAA